jgi:pseudouridine synthase
LDYVKIVPESALNSADGSEKLARYLARCGIASRRKCEELIRAGWVQVNGVTVKTPETRVDAGQDRISYRGRRIEPVRSFRYILFHKPRGVISTCRAGREKGRTVLDFVQVSERIFPAGRLDRDTSGLLILTNDGELVHRLIHPSFEMEREYIARTSRPVQPDELRRLQEGVLLDDGLSKFPQVQAIGKQSLRLVLCEGRKRQIRRTFAAVGLPLADLQRVRFGPIKLGKLPQGAWRDLLPAEVRRLKRQRSQP